MNIGNLSNQVKSKSILVVFLTLIILTAASISVMAMDDISISAVHDISPVDLLEFSNNLESTELICTDDVHGPNDEPGQKDLTRMCVLSSTDPIQVEFNWDEIYGGGANTYDACNLFDTDGDGNANYSFCVTVSANPITDIMEYNTVTLYSCGDDKTDRCTNPINIVPPSPATSCTVSQLDTDPFSAGAEFPLDTVGNCTISRGDVGGDVAVLLNVCSFPSQQPNSDPSDCITEPGSGFLTIVKNATPDIDTVPFEFVINDGQADVDTQIIYGSGTTDRLSFLEGIYSITEVLPENWNLDSISCVDINIGTVGVPSLPDDTVYDLIIQSGTDITCTFTNSRVYSPDITTTPIPSEGYVGDTLNDSAILSEGFNPTGTITFKLYDPSDATCDGQPVFTEIVPVNGNGEYSTSSGYVTPIDGTYRWVAEYSGDGVNNPDSSGCDDELVTIIKYNTTTTTSPNPEVGKVGDYLNDSATVESEYTVTGNVLFKLFEPGDVTCDSPVYTQTVPLVDGTAETSPGYMSNMDGTWRWTAEYQGDNANLPSSSGCQDELVYISKYPTIITTIPDPETAKVGDLLNDNAFVESGYPLTGTVTFRLFQPGDVSCEAAVYTQTVPVGNGDVSTSPGHEADAEGTWRWIAEYSGDYANAPSISGCDDELVIIDKHDPNIWTEPNPDQGLVGITLNDTATLTSSFELIGDVQFKLYKPGDTTCQEPVFTETLPVGEPNAQGEYIVSTTSGYVSDLAGTWRWTAKYLGDFANYPTISGCDEELVDVQKWQPSIITIPEPTSAYIWTRLHDTANLSNGFKMTGHVTFKLFPPGDDTCQDEVYQATVPVTDDSARTILGYVSNQAGTWRWTARYSGDENNHPVESGCDDELVDVYLYQLFVPILRHDFQPPVCSFEWRQTYVGYQVRLDVVWENAAPPEIAPDYHRIKWGDNTHTIFSGESGSRAFWHTYAEPGWYYVYIMLWGNDGQKYFPCEGWVDPP